MRREVTGAGPCRLSRPRWPYPCEIGGIWQADDESDDTYHPPPLDQPNPPIAQDHQTDQHQNGPDSAIQPHITTTSHPRQDSQRVPPLQAAYNLTQA